MDPSFRLYLCQLQSIFSISLPNGPVRANGAEYNDPHLTMCVELIGPRADLMAFCSRYGNLLAGKAVVYKHLEHWTIDQAGVHPDEVTAQELHAEP